MFTTMLTLEPKPDHLREFCLTLKMVAYLLAIIQPYQFGHKFSKRTCLWLKNLPTLKPTKIIKDFESTKKAKWFNKGSGKERQILRSKTFSGIAKAMANQWGKL